MNSDIFRKITFDFQCLGPQEKELCYATNSFEGDIEFDENRTSITRFPKELSSFENNLVHGYLVPTIRLMRLFKEGNIRMPLRYYFLVEGSRRTSLMQSGIGRTIHFSTKYKLSDIEIPDLQHFIQNTSLPFKENFLELAFENFELSYETFNHSLAFLCLMISLEAILNPGESELRYRVSRNTAVLLGESQEEAGNIYKEVRSLYDKRSKLVHTGKGKIVSQEDVLKLRDYVRKSIRKINSTGNNKQNLLDALNTYGFGERTY